MNDVTRKKINSTKTIENAIPSIVEAFVEFYGEDERKNIEEKFKNLLVVGYCSPDNLRTILCEDEKIKLKELVDRYLENVNFKQYEPEELREIVFGKRYSDSISQHKINGYLEFRKGNMIYRNEAVVFLSSFYPQVTVNNINYLIESNQFRELDILVEQYVLLLKEYDEYKKSLQIYEDYIKKCDDLKYLLEEKYIKKFILSMESYFTKNEFNQIKELLNNGESLHKLFSLFPKLRNLINGYSLNSESLISAFNEENEVELNDDDIWNWKRDSIKADRILYFRNLGLDLGDDYDDYLNNPTAISLVPNVDLIEKIISIKDGLYNDMMIEFFNSIDDYMINRKRIIDAQLLDKDDDYNANSYMNNSIFVSTNLVNNNGKYIPYPILCMSMGIPRDYFDVSLIHEFNHIFEFNILSVNDNTYKGVCGWDLVDGEINGIPKKQTQLNIPEEIRDYELFNEIINELISQEICQIMHSSGVYIFNTKENAKIKGGSSYEYMKFLVHQFYKTYKEEIIASRKSGNMNVLFDKIGKKNFDDLNALFKIFDDNFNGFDYYQLIDDLQDEKETEKTRIYNYLIAKRDEILNNMQEYNQTKHH